MEFFGVDSAKNIAKRIKNNTYKFKPVKRNWIPKPGKKKKRPIDVSNQSDRIVQEAIRGILKAIYEPVFKELGNETKDLSNNYGFRPKCSTWSALEIIEKHGKRCTTVIEGDIVSAYNNVDHGILLKILWERIKDKKFLRFIKSMLKSGVMDDKKYEHSLNGTPQGGIVSPLLFNIYMLEFDKYIYKEFIAPVQKKNKYRENEKMSKTYRRIKYQTTVAVEKLKETKKEYQKNKEKIRKAKKKFKETRALKFRTPYNEIEVLKKGAVYARYADDWILALTCNKTEAEQIKEKISKFLNEYRKMQLDQEKTKITHLAKGVKFLGFEIRLNVEKPKLRRVLIKDKGGNYSRPLKRTTSRQITIEPDSKRIHKRLIAQRICKKTIKTFKPTHKAEWIVYDEFEIVQKYAQVFRGIFNYYQPCERLSRLNITSYILQYSCARTLAARKKTSIKKIFGKYTTNMIIEKKIKGTKSEKIRQVKFLTLSNLRKLSNKTKISTPTDQDPFRIKEFWRTTFKLYNECCICGETQGVAYHHINSLGAIIRKKNQTKDRYEVIRSQLNRIQIPVCKKCHQDIHNGRYNDPRKPIEFYNEFLAKL